MVSNKAGGRAGVASRRPRTRGRDRGPPPELPPNVVPLRQRILPRHAEILARWLEAGRPMGLCDASAFAGERDPSSHAPRHDYVLVWVRENIDPAYMVMPEGAQWVVVDAIRQIHMARLKSFEAALNLIRPVLSLGVAA